MAKTHLGAMLHIYIQLEKLPLSEIEKATGMGKSTISRLCTGHGVPCALDTLKLIGWLLETKAKP